MNFSVKLLISASIVAVLCEAHPGAMVRGTTEDAPQYWQQTGRQGGIFGGLGAALAPVVGAIIGPILNNIATSITSGLTGGLANGFGTARPNNLEMYMVQVPGASGPYLLVTTRGDRSRPSGITQAITSSYAPDTTHNKPYAPETTQPSHKPYLPEYTSSRPASEEAQSIGKTDIEAYLDSFQNYHHPEYTKQDDRPSSVKKIFPPEPADSLRKLLNSRTLLQN